MKRPPNNRTYKGPAARTTTIYGQAACRGFVAQRPADILGAYLTERQIPKFKRTLSQLAKQKAHYHIVSNDKLSKIAKSIHHEEICLVVREKKNASLADLLASKEKRITALYLDGVSNPQNVGAILRVAAHLSVKYILGPQAVLPRWTAGVYRVSEGAAELVERIPLKEPGAGLQKLRKNGFQLIGTTSHDGKNLYRTRFSDRTVLVLGAENSGMSRDVSTHVDRQIKIPGTDTVESLNVSVATGIILGEIWRQQHLRLR